jgi:hypothetical protein
MRAFAAVLLTLSLASPALSASEAFKAILGSYLEIHAQLAADKTDGVKAAAAAIATQAESLGPAGAAIVKSAKSLAEAPDLKAARDAFGPLSDAVIAAGQAEGWKDGGGAKVAFCPMVRKSWVQKDEKIRNPYYGSTMLECGEIKK